MQTCTQDVLFLCVINNPPNVIIQKSEILVIIMPDYRLPTVVFKCRYVIVRTRKRGFIYQWTETTASVSR